MHVWGHVKLGCNGVYGIFIVRWNCVGFCKKKCLHACLGACKTGFQLSINGVFIETFPLVMGCVASKLG